MGVRRYQNEDGTLTDAGRARKIAKLQSSTRRTQIATTAAGAVAVQKGTQSVIKDVAEKAIKDHYAIIGGNFKLGDHQFSVTPLLSSKGYMALDALPAASVAVGAAVLGTLLTASVVKAVRNRKEINRTLAEADKQRGSSDSRQS